MCQSFLSTLSHYTISPLTISAICTYFINFLFHILLLLLTKLLYYLLSKRKQLTNFLQTKFNELQSTMITTSNTLPLGEAVSEWDVSLVIATLYEFASRRVALDLSDIFILHQRIIFLFSLGSSSGITCIISAKSQLRSSHILNNTSVVILLSPFANFATDDELILHLSLTYHFSVFPVWCSYWLLLKVHYIGWSTVCILDNNHAGRLFTRQVSNFARFKIFCT